MHIFCIHGYLAPRAIMWPIARHLRKSGYPTTTFGYQSHRGDLLDHARAFAAVINEHTSGEIGILAHSMGGLIARAALPLLNRKPDRLLFISTPHRGCAITRQLRRTAVARWMSPAVKRTAFGLDTPLQSASCGVIVGSKDRLVRAEEAAITGVPSLSLPFGHNELLLRPKTANAVSLFMKHGQFERPLGTEKLKHQLLSLS
jgi:pimeloyl-ACP methyl ester carboxylesterase